MFPERLKEARKSKGLSQKEMAEKLFLSQQAYAKYEVGAAKPNTEMLTQIAAVLDVSIDCLLGIKTKENPAGRVPSEVLEAARILESLDANTKQRMIDLLETLHAQQEAHK